MLKITVFNILLCIVSVMMVKPVTARINDFGIRENAMPVTIKRNEWPSLESPPFPLQPAYTPPLGEFPSLGAPALDPYPTIGHTLDPMWTFAVESRRSIDPSLESTDTYASL